VELLHELIALIPARAALTPQCGPIGASSAGFVVTSPSQVQHFVDTSPER